MDDVQLRVGSDGEVDLGTMTIHEDVHVTPDLPLLVEDPRLEARMLGDETGERFSDIRSVHFDARRTVGEVTERMTQDDDGHGA